MGILYKRSQTVADPRVAEAYDIMQSLKQKVAEQDKCSVFGEQLDFKLWKLDQRNRLILQHKINL